MLLFFPELIGGSGWIGVIIVAIIITNSCCSSSDTTAAGLDGTTPALRAFLDGMQAVQGKKRGKGGKGR